MKVLVTGAAGFLGQHVVKALQERGHQVIGLDLFQLPVPMSGIRDWVMADITKFVPTTPHLDAVVHLAAMAQPRECDANPSRAFDVNVNGTNQVLKMARESGAKRFVFSSSAHVYGVGPRYLPTPESHPLALGNTYTTTKILGEQLCSLYQENHGLLACTLRLFNAYGVGQAPGYFIPDMEARAKKGDITLTGANTTKDFVWAEDVALAFALAVESSYCGPINNGTGRDTALASVAFAITEAHGVKLNATHDDSATMMRADNGRAERVLGWKPTVTIEEGLDRILHAQSSPVRS